MGIIKSLISGFIGVLLGIVIFFSIHRVPPEMVYHYVLSSDSVPAKTKVRTPLLFGENVDSTDNVEIPFQPGLGMKINWDSIKQRVWDYGDSQAYTSLVDYHIYQKSFKQGEFLAYSYRMATKYNDASACFYVYHDLYTLYYKRYLSTFEPETMTFALHFLNKGAKGGNSNAIRTLKELGQN